ncbi:hypothetical protein L0Y49_02315 [bacterium]|nr:hypothetical protein [bacterium]
MSDFENFKKRIERELLTHRVITSNPFTAWWEKGEMNLEQVRAFIVQFSVFSRRFIVAQALKVANSDSFESMRESREILANEIGTAFTNKGTVDGGIYRPEQGHYEWLLAIGERIGLAFGNMGKLEHGTPETLLFCDELVRRYGSEDYKVALASGFAVENWANAGFWKQLIAGFEIFNKKREEYRNFLLPLHFFVFHDRLEDKHADHTWSELEKVYYEGLRTSNPIDEDKFIADGKRMLLGVWIFWEGLDKQRKEKELEN